MVKNDLKYVEEVNKLHAQVFLTIVGHGNY
jgi:hypothetical protein